MPADPRPEHLDEARAPIRPGEGAKNCHSCRFIRPTVGAHFCMVLDGVAEGPRDAVREWCRRAGFGLDGLPPKNTIPCPGFAERGEAQPDPIPNDHPAVWDLVIADMRSRDAKGLRTYGTRLQPGNGRDALRDAYEEALDLAVYLRQAIEERSLTLPARSGGMEKP